MDLDSCRTLHAASVGVEDLADIFEDPLLNDLTDNLLNDIDIHELRNFPNDYTEQTDVIPYTAVNTHGKSNHATLEALLRSQSPRTCVPPAPDLQTGTNLPANVNVLSEKNTNSKSWDSFNHSDVTGYVAAQQHTIKSKADSTRVSPTSRLICDYLGKCSTDSQSPYLVAPTSKYLAVKPCNTEVSEHESSSWENVCAYKRTATPSRRFKNQGLNLMWSSMSCTNGELSNKVSEKPAKRAPHNAIEKRYRASINGRIDELRKILIPFPSADAKLNKSAVLRQAIDRIKELEEKTERLQAEVILLRRLHAIRMSKSDHGNLETDRSLDPSPTTSNYNPIDFGLSTPPSEGSCHDSSYNTNGTVLTAPSTASPLEMASQADVKEPSCLTPWSLTLSSPEKPESTGVLNSVGCVPTDTYTFDPSTYHFGSDEASMVPADVTTYPPPILETYDRGHTLLAPRPSADMEPLSLDPISTISGIRGKRVAVAPDCGPPKMRRSLDLDIVQSRIHPVPARFDDVRSNSFVSQLSVSKGDPYSTPGRSTTELLPGVHRVLSQPGELDSNQLSARSIKCKSASAPDRVVLRSSGGGLNDLAARTTLCVSALCLITLDPAVLTATGSGSESQGTGSATTARRLLTISSSSWNSSFSSWMNCALYLFQWIVALFFCFWAWNLGTGRNSTRQLKRKRPTVSDRCNLKLIRMHWIEANAAHGHGALTLTKKHLLTCLGYLAEPISEMSSTNGLWTGIRSWFGFSLNLISLCVLHIPYSLCRRTLTCLWSRLTRTRSTASVLDKEEDVITPPTIRSRLLELCLLERLDNSRSNCVTPDKLSFAQLFVHCCKDFIYGHTSVDNEIRRGVVLALAARDILHSRYLCGMFLRWTANRLNQKSERTENSLWNHIVTNPCFKIILMDSTRSLSFPPGAGNELIPLHQFPERLRNALHKQLLTHCLKVILYGSQCGDMTELRAYFDALLTMPFCNSDREFSGDGSVPYLVEQNTWWSEILYIVWLQRHMRFPASKNTVEYGELFSNRTPPNVVFNCPRTGALARAIWLLYRKPSCPFSSTKQACRLVTKSIQIHFAYPVETEAVDSFQMTAWQLLALDRILSNVLENLTHADDDLIEASVRNVNHTNVVTCLASALHLLRSLTHPPTSSYAFDQPYWIQEKLSYAETVYRLALGANPVRTRLALLQYRQMSKTRSSPSPKFFSTHLPQGATQMPEEIRRASTPSQDSGLEMLDCLGDESEDNYDRNDEKHEDATDWDDLLSDTGVETDSDEYGDVEVPLNRSSSSVVFSETPSLCTSKSDVRTHYDRGPGSLTTNFSLNQSLDQQFLIRS